VSAEVRDHVLPRAVVDLREIEFVFDPIRLRAEVLS